MMPLRLKILGAVAFIAFSIASCQWGLKANRDRHQVRLHELKEQWISTVINRLKSGDSKGKELYSCVNTDEMLQRMSGMQEVEWLTFHQTIDLSEVGLQYLSTMPNLRLLSFYSNEHPTNDSLQLLVDCKSLEILSLHRSNVSDEGLQAIAKITTLKKFQYDGEFSEEAIEMLKSKLPDCDIQEGGYWE